MDRFSTSYTSLRSEKSEKPKLAPKRFQFNWSKADTRAALDCVFALVLGTTFGWILVNNLGWQNLAKTNMVAIATIVFLVVYLSFVKPVFVKRVSDSRLRTLINTLAGLLVVAGVLFTIWLNLSIATQHDIAHILGVIGSWVPFALILIISGAYFLVYRNRLDNGSSNKKTTRSTADSMFE